mgnify:CR=1 FL=1
MLNSQAVRVGFVTQLLWPRYGRFWQQLAEAAGAESVFPDLAGVSAALHDEAVRNVPGAAFRLAAAQAVSLAEEVDVLVVPRLNRESEVARGAGQDPWISDFPGALQSAVPGLPAIRPVLAELDAGVETEGDLTVKIENNTDTGEGIYAEPVDNPDQTLDDAEIFYAVLGNLILLKIRPYQEPRSRYLVYSEKTQQVRRLDSIEHACVLLPDDQGIIVSNGYFLQTGECKIFESALSEMVYHSRVQSPNGEDYLFVFYNRLSGDYVLLPYNLIEQKVGTPILCNGFTLFDSGEMNWLSR